MPISFPAKPRGRPGIQAKNLIQKPFDYVPAPNMGNPNYRLTADTLGSGRGKIERRSNPRSPGVNFATAYAIANLDQRPQPLRDNALWKETLGTLNAVLSGISRDSTGAILGNCQVMIFRTSDRLLVAETTSDVNGNWSVSLLVGGPFFLVEYLAGSPDVAGTSVNTLIPVQV